jgi:hypothetical protein
MDWGRAKEEGPSHLGDLVEFKVELIHDGVWRIHSVAHDAGNDLDCSLRADQHKY